VTLRKFVDAALWTTRVSLSVVVGFMIAPLVAQMVASAVTSQWPVMDDWVVDSVRVVGPDLHVTGSMYKRWDWEYIAPPRAHVAGADRPLGVVSLAPAPSTPWPAGERRTFGPWVVKNGAEHEVIVFQQQHKLLGFINSYSELGTLNVRTVK
jgi:hypothetical protein